VALLYRILADLVVVAHVLFIAFVAVGSMLVSKWSGLLWLHVPAVLWAAAIVLVGFTCPLTLLEKDLREREGDSSYDGGFIDHYLEGVVYPGRFTALARLLVAVLIVGGYVRLVARRRRREQSSAGRRAADGRSTSGDDQGHRGRADSPTSSTSRLPFDAFDSRCDGTLVGM
jgi:hypothetical protein